MLNDNDAQEISDAFDMLADQQGPRPYGWKMTGCPPRCMPDPSSKQSTI
jgi:hypothetical protein